MEAVVEGGDVMVSMDFTELEGMLRPILQGAVQVGNGARPARTSASPTALRFVCV